MIHGFWQNRTQQKLRRADAAEPVPENGRQCSVECRSVSFDQYFCALSEAASALRIGSYRPVFLSLGRTLGRTSARPVAAEKSSIDV
jgi:hypothetical protein